jgi:hypothetical protein
MPVKRFNWSVNWSYELHLPATKTYAPNIAARSVMPGDSFIRIERQSLIKMPVSGDLLFTIRVYIDPVKAMEENPELSSAALSLADQLEGLTTEQSDYKGLTEKRPALVQHLREIAKRHATA